MIDRWYDDIRTYQKPEVILRTWIEERYTHLLLYQAGAEFIRDSEPRYTSEDWQNLETLLTYLPPPRLLEVMRFIH